MNYFVTGATGFIGRFLVARLLKREGARVFALVRPGSEYKLDAMRRRLCVEESRLVPITGDLTKKLLGVSKRDQDDLVGQIDHFFHLAAGPTSRRLVFLSEASPTPTPHPRTL